MRPAVLIPLIVFGGLFGSLAWVEYSQHSGLMRQAASADVAQLCADLKNARECPAQLRLRWHPGAATDPWSRPYACRPTLRGLLLYTFGADAEAGGFGRDTDIACVMVFTSGDAEPDEQCPCAVGDEASALLR